MFNRWLTNEALSDPELAQTAHAAWKMSPMDGGSGPGLLLESMSNPGMASKIDEMKEQQMLMMEEHTNMMSLAEVDGTLANMIGMKEETRGMSLQQKKKTLNGIMREMMGEQLDRKFRGETDPGDLLEETV